MSLKLGSQILSNNGTLPSTSEEKTLLKGFIKGKLNKIKELEIDKDKFYSIDDLPDNSITNEMMEAVLSDNKTAAFFALNNTYVCVDDGNYKKGTTYKFNGDSWEEISSGGGGIEQLVGTEEKPINLHSDLEVGVYLIKGQWLETASTRKQINQPTLCVKTYKSDNSSVVNLYELQYNRSDPSFGKYMNLNFDSRGYVTSRKYGSIAKFNGSETTDIPNVYCPTTGGTAGQILQSNGSGAPTWVDANFEHKLTKETYNISNWTTLSDAAPYTYSTTITATYTIGEDTEVELINDNAVLFAKYGFTIASVNGQEIKIYSVTQPSESISLTIGFRG